MTKEIIKNVINMSDQFQLEKPLPLRKKIEEAESYPVDALGGFLGDVVFAIYDKVQAPIAICAQSVLAAANLAVQGHANIELPTGEIKPISCIFITIAETGERKSSCDSLALKPIRAYEKKLYEDYKIKFQSWANEFEAYDAIKKEIKRVIKKSKEEIKNKLDSTGLEPLKPISPMIICDDPTFQGLAKQLEHGQPSMGIFNDEGGQLLGGYSMNKENKTQTLSAFSKLWDGSPMSRVRSIDGSSKIYGKRVAIHLMVQPIISRTLLSDEVALGQGFLSRVLVTHPNSTSGTRFWKDPKKESGIVIYNYNERIAAILEMPMPLKADTQNELEPRTIKFVYEAEDAWKVFCDHIEIMVGKGGQLEPVKGLANKLPEHAARLAATLALIDDINASYIDVKHIDAGIKLAQFHASEALRLFDQGRTNPNILRAERLLHWLEASWNERIISPPDIYQIGAAGITDRKLLDPILEILIKHKYLLPIEGRHEVNGKTRAEVYRINLG